MLYYMLFFSAIQRYTQQGGCFCIKVMNAVEVEGAVRTKRLVLAEKANQHDGLSCSVLSRKPGTI